MFPALVIDACPLLHTLSGIGRYTYEVARRVAGMLGDGRLAYHYGPVASRAPTPDRDEMPGIMRCRVPYAAHLWVHWRHFLERNGHRRWPVYWEPNNACPFGVQPRRLVLTLHDFSWIHHREWHPPERVRFMRHRVPWSVAQAAAIITGTRHSRDEILNRYRVPAERIHVIPHGVDRDHFRPLASTAVSAFRARHRLAKPYVLYLGNLEPRKNVRVVLAAWTDLPTTTRRNCELVLVGAGGWGNQAELDRVRGDDSIRLITCLPEAELPACYGGASLFVYPSLYEGFGLPPVEALACGCPVAVAAVPPMSEVCGASAIQLPPDDPGAWTNVISQHLADNPSTERTLAPGTEAQLAEYTWHASAARHLAVFRTATAH